MCFVRLYKKLYSVLMSCVSPIPVMTRSGAVVNAACGRCLSCCIAKQSSLNFLASKELELNYKRGQGASFVTLTYDDNNVNFVSDTAFMTLKKKIYRIFSNVCAVVLNIICLIFR